MQRILFLVHVLLCCITAQAQVQFGVKAGGNISNVRSKYGVNHNARIGFQGGVFSHIAIDDKFAVRPEALYAVKGYKFPATQFNSGGTVGLSYINVPVLAVYQPAKQLQLLAGPEAGILIKANSYFDGKNHDVTNNFNRKFDLGIIAGGLYAFTNQVAADLRLNYSLMAIQKGTLTDQLGNVIGTAADGYNISVQLSFNYAFK